VGLAALTKTSALLLVPLALAAVFLSPGGTARQKVARALVVLGTAVVVGGWWYGRNALLYGDPLGISRHVQTPWGRQTPASLATLLSEMPRLYRSFWGAFGWGHVEYPAWVYVALGGLVVLALVGWGQALYRQFRTGQALSEVPGTLILSAAWCGAVFLALLQWMRQVEAPHGRLLFPAIGAWALLTAVGWEHLPWPREARSGVLLALVLLNLLTPFSHPPGFRPAAPFGPGGGHACGEWAAVDVRRDHTAAGRRSRPPLGGAGGGADGARLLDRAGPYGEGLHRRRPTGGAGEHPHR
jgi:hypothetical protein